MYLGIFTPALPWLTVTCDIDMNMGCFRVLESYWATYSTRGSTEQEKTLTCETYYFSALTDHLNAFMQVMDKTLQFVLNIE